MPPRPVTIYLRVAATARGFRAAATTRPNESPLVDSNGDALPTVPFAIRVNIPAELWRYHERVVAELTLPVPVTEADVELVP
jgi:hypothetical protein